MASTAVALALVLLPGTMTAAATQPADAAAREWAEDFLAGGELRFATPGGQAYTVRMAPGSFLASDPDDANAETTVVLRGADGDASAALVATQGSVRVVANTPEGTHRYRTDGGPVPPEDRLDDVTWQGRPL